MQVDLVEIDEPLTPNKETVQGMSFPPMCMLDKLMNAFHTPFLGGGALEEGWRWKKNEKRDAVRKFWGYIFLIITGSS